MNHSFNTEIAEKVGIVPAIMLEHIAFWVLKNKANQTNEKDGRFWTFSTTEGFQKLFPYMTIKQIRSALDKLNDEGFLITGCFNLNSFDRTKWYSLGEKAEEFYHLAQEKNPSVELPQRANGIAPQGKSDLPHRANAFAPEGRPIPDINNKDINKDISPPIVPPRGESARASRLPADWMPSEEDIKYCRLKRPDLDIPDTVEAFRDYWHAKAGRDACKLDWHATWRNWVRNERARPKRKKSLEEVIAERVAARERSVIDAQVREVGYAQITC